MVAPVAIAVYTFAFLISILYTIDAIVQWRNPRGGGVLEVLLCISNSYPMYVYRRLCAQRADGNVVSLESEALLPLIDRIC
jgi:hypothetical protein